jgi:hypothetical protein
MVSGIRLVVKHSTTYLDIKGSNLAGAWNAGGYREEKRFYSTWLGVVAQWQSTRLLILRSGVQT